MNLLKLMIARSYILVDNNPLIVNPGDRPKAKNTLKHTVTRQLKLEVTERHNAS